MAQCYVSCLSRFDWLSVSTVDCAIAVTSPSRVDTRGESKLRGERINLSERQTIRPAVVVP